MSPSYLVHVTNNCIYINHFCSVPDTWEYFVGTVTVSVMKMSTVSTECRFTHYVSVRWQSAGERPQILTQMSLMHNIYHEDFAVINVCRRRFCASCGALLTRRSSWGAAAWGKWMGGFTGSDEWMNSWMMAFNKDMIWTDLHWFALSATLSSLP